jgi:superoxide dismutase, Fe-Mn family
MQDSAIGRRAALAAMGTLGASAVALAGLGQPEGGQPGRGRRDPDVPRGERPPGRLPQPLTDAQLGWDPVANQYVLPPLPYTHAALEPHIDEQTMRLHHEQHHRSYVNNLNRALRSLWEVRESRGDENLTAHWMRQVSFNGSGHFNHCLFWQIMAPPAASADGAQAGAQRGGGGQPQGELAEAVGRDFGSFAQFSAQFQQTARSVAGGGWAWLALDTLSTRLMIVQMESQQDSVLNGMVPLMGVDVWEHAYYLRYQNRRAEYVEAFMNVINWPRVEDLFVLASRRFHWRQGAGPQR